MLGQPSVRVTPLHDRHLGAGARMVAFAGWDMPLQYQGLTDEHLTVRKGSRLSV